MMNPPLLFRATTLTLHWTKIMVSFALTEDQLEYQRMTRQFIAQNVIENAGKWDEESHFPKAEIEAAWDNGLLNLCIPESLGGSGMSLMDTLVISEEVAYGCVGYSTSCMANELALTPIVVGGDEAQKEKFLKPFLNDFRLASFCLSEPGAGSDAAGIRTTATKDGDSWVIDGQKQWITNATYADFYTVFATVDREAGHRGITLFAVPRDLPGITVGPHENKMGQRCSDTAPISFDKVRIPADHCIGGPGKGWKIAMRTLDFSRPLVAISAVGVAQRALDEAISYAKERQTFGKPIIHHQAIAFKLADMAAKVQAARLLSYEAAWRTDNDLPANKEASFAKAMAADWGMEICTEAVQIFGGYGYTKEYPVEKLMRDAKLMQIYEGTSEIQRIVISRELMR
jgi:acyl-CoA dehydrogenase